MPSIRTTSRSIPPATRCDRCTSGTGRRGCCGRCAASTFTDLPRYDECCGFGGTFSVKNADVSTAMAEGKVRAVLETGADVCTAADNSCLMHIGGVLAGTASGVRCVHIAEILASPRSGRGGQMIRVGDAAAAPAFSGGGARGARKRSSCDATSAAPPTSSAASARAWSARRPTGRSCARPGAQIKAHVLRHLDDYLDAIRGALHARRRPRALGARRGRSEPHRRRRSSDAHGETEVIKVKTMTSDETRLNTALEEAGIAPYETDLADLIIQLGADRPSHIVVPALHRNRAEIRDDLPSGRWGWAIRTDEPEDLARGGAAVPAREVPARPGRVQRRQLRDRRHRIGVRGRVGGQRADVRHAAAGAGHAGRHREGRSRRWRDLEVFLQLLPRSATGERMNPYNSIWTGVSGRGRPRRVPRRAAR